MVYWLVAGLAIASFGRVASAADDSFWALSPYRVSIELAVDTKSVPRDLAARKVAEHIQQRADATVGAMWNVNIHVLGVGATMDALATSPADWLRSNPEITLSMKTGSGEDAVDQSQGSEVRKTKPDKRILITLRETGLGIIVGGAEQDMLLERVGRPQKQEPCEVRMAPEAAFTLLTDVFSPVATFQVTGDKKEDVELVFRGSSLPRKPAAEPPVEEGAIMLPVLRRTDRDGTVAEEGIQIVPWTYLMVANSGAGEGDSNAYLAKIYSHTRRPFGVRRRGRVNQYAVLLPPGEGSTEVYLHAREKPDVPLTGYQAFLQDGENAKRVSIGSSDIDGIVRVKPGKSAIQVVYIKVGSKVVAKAPIAVGAVERVTIPLLDERKRLEAEAKLSILREELIDLVARRSILGGRVRTKIRQGDLREARKLFNELNDMPGRTQFSLRLSRTRQQSKSDDPRVQQRIDSLFEDTESVLGAFLSLREVGAIREELAAAERSGSKAEESQDSEDASETG